MKLLEVVEEYFMDGQINQGGAVSDHRSWLDGQPGLTPDAEITAARKSDSCIKAIGSAEGTERLVGTSVGAAAPTSVLSPLLVGSLLGKGGNVWWQSGAGHRW